MPGIEVNKPRPVVEARWTRLFAAAEGAEPKVLVEDVGQ